MAEKVLDGARMAHLTGLILECYSELARGDEDEVGIKREISKYCRDLWPGVDSPEVVLGRTKGEETRMKRLADGKGFLFQTEERSETGSIVKYDYLPTEEAKERLESYRVRVVQEIEAQNEILARVQAAITAIR